MQTLMTAVSTLLKIPLTAFIRRMNLVYRFILGANSVCVLTMSVPDKRQAVPAQIMESAVDQTQFHE